MKTLKLFVAAAILGGTMMAAPSCGKYEEGPGFSLRSKKSRLAGEWDAKEYVDADGTTIADTDDDYITFEKDGTYKVTSDGTSVSGTWEFASDKEKLRTSYTVGGMTFTGESTIVRLTNKELWIKDEDGDMTKLEAK